MSNKNPDLPELGQRFEGSMSIVPHPTDPDMYGNGTLEVEGRLYVDEITSDSPGFSGSITIKSPIDLAPWSAMTTSPNSGMIRLYADSNQKLVAQLHSGEKYLLNPLLNTGDISVFSDNGPVRLGVGNNNQVLTVDFTQPSKVAWKDPVAHMQFEYNEDSEEMHISSSTYVVRHKLDFTVHETSLYHIDIEYAWMLSDASANFYSQILLNDSVVHQYVSRPIHVDYYRKMNVVKNVVLGEGTYSLTLRIKSERKAATIVKGVVCDVWQVL